MDIETIFKEIAGRVDAEKMKDISASVQFSLDGGDDYYLKIENGTPDYGKGTMDGDPSATVSMTAEDFKDLTSGNLNPVMAFMSGKIKVDGDMSTVMQLQQVLSG